MTNIIVAFPLLFFNYKFSSSNFISVFIYTLIYVPSIVGLQLYYQDYSYSMQYQIAFMLSVSSFFLCGHIIPRKRLFISSRIIGEKFWVLFGTILILIVVLAYGPSSFKMVSFDDVYSLRSETSYVSASNPIIGYCVMWMSFTFNPFFIALGLAYKKRFLLLLGIVGSLLIYMSSGAKIALSTPFISVMIYYSFNKLGFKNLLISIILFFVAIYMTAAVNEQSSHALFLVLSLLLMRTLGISALLTPAYIDVFTKSPYTYFSHINIINFFTQMYPFDYPVLGIAVWSEYSGRGVDSSMNANANFIITDGIASCGIVGIFIVSFIFCLILLLLNKLTFNLDEKLVSLLLVGPSLSLLNVSLFTTLLSAGLLIVMIILFTSGSQYESKSVEE